MTMLVSVGPPSAFGKLTRAVGDSARAAIITQARALDELHTQRGPRSTPVDYRRVFSQD